MWPLNRLMNLKRNLDVYRFNLFRFIILNARTIEREVIPACQEYGLGLIPWSPLAGVLRKIEEGRRASERIEKAIAEDRPQLEQWEGFCLDEIWPRPRSLRLVTS
jgi:aryl-alcohol dehydrogenase-like predicted oxidoreductase